MKNLKTMIQYAILLIGLFAISGCGIEYDHSVDGVEPANSAETTDAENVDSPTNE